MKRRWRTVWRYLTRLGVVAWNARWLRLVLGIAGVVGFLWLIVVLAPPWFVDDESLEGLKAQNEVRTTLLQGLAGSVLLVGAYFTWRQLGTTREGQITERYTRAIDQLGHPELDVRLGGIYALERIARDSPSDWRTIAEVLTAFIRTHAPWPPRLPGQYRATAPIAEVPVLEVRAPDVQAALVVLGRGDFTSRVSSMYYLNLQQTDLRRANLRRLKFNNTMLQGAHLELAYMPEAHLIHAYLEGAHLEDAFMPGAKLQGAILHGAHMETETLGKANLKEARADGRTAWPAGFDWRAAGVNG